MNIEMQQTNFTHAKCTNCGHLSMIGNFEQKKANEARSENDNNGVMEFYQLILLCPLCGDDSCEALFPSDVN